MSATPTGAAIPRDPTEAIIDTILRREGWPRYTDRPSDRGGPTKGGITLATLTNWRKRPVMRNIAESRDYWSLQAPSGRCL
nr:glycosyl hydrolase 108 family protein [Azospirillum sp. 412522]